MPPFSPAPLRAGSLRDAANHAREATAHLLALTTQPNLSKEQGRRLRCLAACAALTAEGSERLMLELSLP
jgi:hypothetical protein